MKAETGEKVAGELKEPAAPSNVLQRWMAAMFRGDFEAAWRVTDLQEAKRRRLESAGAFCWDERYLVWNGTPFRDRHVLVRCHHGLGDTIQFARFLPRLRAVAESLTVLVQPALLPLLRETPGFGEMQNGWTGETNLNAEVEVEIMELAYAFRCTAKMLPRAFPYLPLQKIRSRARKDLQIGNGQVRRVGLIWAASGWDESRSVPTEALAALSNVSGVEFYSLQQGRPAEEYQRLPLTLQRLDLQTQEVVDVAAAMLELDLVISVDSMTAHLAGALGRPVWLLLQDRADWRWTRSGEKSLWYPSMRIFRQREQGDWLELMGRIAPALAEWAALKE